MCRARVKVNAFRHKHTSIHTFVWLTSVGCIAIPTLCFDIVCTLHNANGTAYIHLQIGFFLQIRTSGLWRISSLDGHARRGDTAYCTWLLSFVPYEGSWKSQMGRIPRSTWKVIRL